MPALHRGNGLNAVRESGSAGVSPAIRERTEKPRQRGFEIRHGIETATRRQTPGRRPPTAGKARQRAFSLGAKHGARASRPPGPERGRLARNSRAHREAPSTGLMVQPVIETVTRRETPGRRPPAAEKARQRACAWVDSPARPWREGPSTGLRIGRYHATTKGRELITVLCRSQHVTLQQLSSTFAIFRQEKS